MSREHDYEEDYEEYDDWLDIESIDDKSELSMRIQLRFKLSSDSADDLASTLWNIKNDRIMYEQSTLYENEIEQYHDENDLAAYEERLFYRRWNPAY